MSNRIALGSALGRMILQDHGHVVLTETVRQHDDGPELRSRCESLEQQLRSANAALEQERAQSARLKQHFEKSLDQAMHRVDQRLDQEVGSLSVRLAEVLVRHTLPDGQMMQDIIRELMAGLRKDQDIRIRVHPTDLEKLQDKEGAGHGERWQADESLQVGDVIIETDSGYLDGRLDERVRLLKDALMDRINHSGGPS